MNNIANPDGLFVDPHGNLRSSKDTGNHTNNMLWRWDGKKLVRIPAGVPDAEYCSVQPATGNMLWVFHLWRGGMYRVLLSMITADMR